MPPTTTVSPARGIERTTLRRLVCWLDSRPDDWSGMELVADYLDGRTAPDLDTERLPPWLRKSWLRVAPRECRVRDRVLGTRLAWELQEFVGRLVLDPPGTVELFGIKAFAGRTYRPFPEAVAALRPVAELTRGVVAFARRPLADRPGPGHVLLLPSPHDAGAWGTDPFR